MPPMPPLGGPSSLLPAPSLHILFIFPKSFWVQRKLSLHQVRKRRHIGSTEPEVPSTTKQGQKVLLGTWRVAGSTQLQDLALRSTLVSSSTEQEPMLAQFDEAERSGDVDKVAFCVRSLIIQAASSRAVG
eukprot:816222-Pelagomonas_calceolata.AAC.1